MMLPSDNDAALPITENFGAFLYLELQGKTQYIKSLFDFNIEEKEQLENINNLQYFLNEMNATAKEYELTDTSFANPHGLNNRANRSTAFDKLLSQPGFTGIKTGQTSNAGSCLCSCFQNADSEFIICVLNSRYQDDKFKDTMKLVSWAIEQKKKTMVNYQQVSPLRLSSGDRSTNSTNSKTDEHEDEDYKFKYKY